MNPHQGPLHHHPPPPPPSPVSSPYSQAPPQLPQARVKVVAGYALQQKLGSGSFAIVYKGVRVQPLGNIQDFAAIKAIARNSEKLTKKVIQNLEMEISILRTYRHRNIVCMHDVQKTVNHFYLVLEYCSGGDVQGLIRSRKDRRLSEGLTRRLMRDLAHGLSFLWKQQLIHRDIKPQNLLLTGPLPLDELYDPECTPDAEERRRIANFPSSDFCLKIADFGFARHLQSTSLAETLCGSPLYMAPEILQHHRYDAKADLWSVGTVLFEMISGEPPFHGENHIDLLRNIQRKAVRLPKDVRVSKECVNLLRVLLSRNPLTRAGFKEFFEACNALVALGCHGNTSVDEGTCKRPSVDLGTIPEYQEDTSISTVTPTAAAVTATSVPSQLTESVMTATTSSSIPQTQQLPQPQQNIPQAATSNPNTVSVASVAAATKPRNTSMFNPLGMYTTSTPTPTVAPTMTELTTIQSNTGSQRMPQRIEMPTRQKDIAPALHNSTDENSFVMVEYGSSSIHKPSSPVIHETSNTTTTTKATTAMVSHYNESVRMKDGRQHQHLLEQSPPTSAGFFMSRMPTLPSRASDYSIVRGAKGMLSTSPGTGGALMNMLTGRPNLLTRGISGSGVSGLAVRSIDTEKQLEQQFKAAAKMLATAEDIGRRAISVAHLGDKRAYYSMRFLLMSESNSSSILSITPMEGIEEESSGDHDDSGGTVTDDDDDSSSTEVMASTTRRRISTTSNADKSMPDVKTDNDDNDDEEEMPFAVQSESMVSPFLAANMPTRSGPSFNNSNDSATNRRLLSKPSPVMIRSHFNEALTCYLKALKMIKGALSVTEDVSKEVTTLEGKRLSPDQQSYVVQLKKQCDVTSNWLSNQFQGVLERGNATNTEITKLPQPAGVEESSMSSSKQNIVVTSVEELLYTHSLGYGREGAVKQLLGHYEAARACYRSAGLLAETLLMEPHVEGEDRQTLEAYVDGFAAQITELDELLTTQQQQQQSRGLAIGSGSGSMATSSRRNSQSSMFPGK